MRRLTLFLKGNVDLYDSLHSCRIGGKLCWNGVNEIVRTRYPGVSIRMRHETSTSSEALLEATGSVPVELSDCSAPLGAYPLESQFSTKVFETDADVIVMSVMPEIATRLVRHQRAGFPFYPNSAGSWPAHEQEWLRREFVETAPLTVEQSMGNLEKIVDRIRERSQAPILIYNLSFVMPGEHIHCHLGLDEVFSTAVRRFNLGLIELSAKTGVSIVDVDAVLARAGADGLKIDAMHLSPEGCRLVAEDVVRILCDLGLFEADAPPTERRLDACEQA
ncbi:SGNH/GDSL hydrolase family protein [Methylocella silvestris]|uniref:SGNH/GDSL hydrolase family protein n=1 Tax=Methylocella silvestris TaxID=199596 RepID=A0A2J7TD83_METSI|nr:SGNH/GDSL hydrolase family protein [Methylocella silvestris]PNG24722.1 SGNH/GDSL hydrolase family protein [Methylocella silvestris]